VRIERRCVHVDCPRYCFYEDSDPRYKKTLTDIGWLFRDNGDALCPPHAKYLDAVNYFSQFAAF